MKVKSLFFILFVISTTTVFSNNTIQTPEGMGFYEVHNAPVPEAVKKSALSTFKLVLVSGDVFKASQIFSVSNLSEAIAFVNSLDERSFSEPEKLVFNYQIDKCIQDNLDMETCLLFEGTESGTGFISNDGFIMRTAYHVVDDLVEKKFGQNQPLPIFIFDNDNKLLYTPDNLTITINNIGAKDLNDLNEQVLKKVDDIVSLKLSKKIAEPIPMATDFNASDEVYFAGFVIATTDRGNYNAPNSDGKKRIISKGHVMSPTEGYARALIKFGSTSLSEVQFLGWFNYLIISTTDGGPMLSGAPTLNQKGECIGIYNFGAPQSGKAEPLRFSYSVPVKFIR